MQNNVFQSCTDHVRRPFPRPLYEDAAELLRQRILGGDLPPGSWIDELRLAEQYGISRTPLREALKVLAAEGLVTMKPRRGAYVTEVPAADLDKLFHLLALLEGDAAAAVARLATPAELDELEALHRQLEQAAHDNAAFYTLNVAFHARMLEIAGNRWQTQMVNDLRRLVRLARVGSLNRAGRVQDALAQHQAVLQALRARDGDAAAAHMRHHLQGALEAALHVSSQ
ncbi:MAG: GntR family transcriptional regulator [Pseudorhodoferax sp.]